MAEENARGPVLEAIKQKLADYIKTLDVNQVIALVMSLLMKKQENTFSAANSVLADLQAEIEQLSPEDQQELLAILQS